MRKYLVEDFAQRCLLLCEDLTAFVRGITDEDFSQHDLSGFSHYLMVFVWDHVSAHFKGVSTKKRVVKKHLFRFLFAWRLTPKIEVDTRAEWKAVDRIVEREVDFFKQAEEHYRKAESSLNVRKGTKMITGELFKPIYTTKEYTDSLAGLLYDKLKLPKDSVDIEAASEWIDAKIQTLGPAVTKSVVKCSCVFPFSLYYLLRARLNPHFWITT